MFHWRITLLFLCISTVLFGQELDDHDHGHYYFKENKGQWPEHINYCADVNGGKIWLEKGRILYQFSDRSDLHETHANLNANFNGTPKYRESLVFAEFLNANKEAATTHKNPTKGYYNYFLGNDESKWAKDVRGYNHIQYNELYPGIDLVFYEKEYDLKYDFKIAPQANPNDIQIKYYAEKKVKINKKGNLIVTTELGELQEQKPYAYQLVNGKIVEVPCEFTLDKNVVSFKLGDYNKNAELIIDPILVFATYCGSTTDNFGMTATYAYTGEAYSGGIIYGNAYPVPSSAWNTTSTFTTTYNGVFVTDVFISKYSADGTQMIWTNFIGGGDPNQGTETVHSLICDTLNNIYFFGATSSADFPTNSSIQNSHGGGSPINFDYNGVHFNNNTNGTDIFVSKISADGMSLMGSTYFGGSGNDGVNYLDGSIPYNSSALYDSITTNYGDQFRGEIMLDSVNNILISSCTKSTDFPTVNPFQANNNGDLDAVLFKINNDFTSVISSSYFGGSNNDAGYSVKVDSSGNILMAGGTSSNDIANMNGHQPAYGGGETDGYVIKLPPDLSAVDFGSYVGTNVYDQVFFVDIDRADNVYILGQSQGSMPISSGVYSNPNSSHFVWRLDPQLSTITKSTVFGNGTNAMMSPAAFMIDVCGNIYISHWGGGVLPGDPAISGLPVTSDAYLQSSPNGRDFHLMVLEREMNSLLYGSYLGGGSASEHVDGGTSRFDKYGVVYQSVCGGCGGFSDFPTTPDAWSSQNLTPNGRCNNLVFKFDFEIVPKAEFFVDQFEGCAPLTITFDNNSGGTDDYLWDFGNGDQTTTENPVRTFPTPGTYIVTLYVTDSVCNLTDTAQKIVTVHPELILDVSNDTLLCSSNPFDIIADSYGTASDFTWASDPNFTNVLNPGGDSIVTINPSQPGYFYVEASNPFCTIKDSVFVDFIGSAITVSNDTSICEGDTLTLEVINQNPNVTLTYNWFPTTSILGSNNGSSVDVLPSNSGYVYVQAQTSNGCTILDSVYIDLVNLPESSVFATAEPDTIAAGGSTVLTAFPEDADHYLWIPTFNTTDPNASSITVYPDQDEQYVVYVTKNGCERYATVKVYVEEFACEPPYIFVPNAFTPNNDGRNDMVFVRGLNLEELEFAIYDRWGEKIFNTTDQSEGWDGTFKGKPMDPDVYMYYLSGTCVGGDEFILKGDITLIR